MTAPARRTRTITETTVSVPTIVVPKGRSAAERRLAAIAALHQPVERVDRGVAGIYADRVFYVCSECKTANDIGRPVSVLWPCTTVKLLGPWPGEVPE